MKKSPLASLKITLSTQEIRVGLDPGRVLCRSISLGLGHSEAVTRISRTVTLDRASQCEVSVTDRDRRDFDHGGTSFFGHHPGSYFWSILHSGPCALDHLDFSTILVFPLQQCLHSLEFFLYNMHLLRNPELATTPLKCPISEYITSITSTTQSLVQVPEPIVCLQHVTFAF